MKTSSCKAKGRRAQQEGWEVISALFVETDGCYFGLPNIDPWDQSRDARNYHGPHKVIAHPPCERWGRYWSGGPSANVKRLKGDDKGCFYAALHAVRSYGGVLEHPEASHAWTAFGLNKPPQKGGWVRADEFGGWTCCVAQGHYGHPAQKLTWLYANGIELPELKWGLCPGRARLDVGYHSKEERTRANKTQSGKRLTKKQNISTPIEFRDLLIRMVTD